MLETQRILDNSANPPTYKASLTITAPPIVSLTASTGGWVVTTASDQTFGTYIASVTGAT